MASAGDRGTQPGARDLIGGVVVGTAAALFGSIVILGKLAADRGMPLASLLALRFAVAATVLGIVLAVAGRPLRPAPGEGPRLVVLGALGYAVESGLFFMALGRGGAAAVTLLFFTYPVWVAVLSAVLGKGLPGWLVGSALVAAVAGAGLVVTASGDLTITAAAIGFALAAAVTASLWLIGTEAWVRRTPSLVSAMWFSGTAAAALGGVALASGTGRVPASGTEWALVTGMGVLTAGAFFLLFAGLRRIGAVRSSIISAFEPVATALLAVLILREPLSAGMLSGGLLIVAGAVAASLARRVPEPGARVP